MANFAGIPQMGRVRSQLKHDYKPRGPLSNPPPLRSWVVVGLVSAVVSLALFLPRTPDTPAPAGAAQAPDAAASGAMITLQIPLPSKADSVDSSTAQTLDAPSAVALPAETPVAGIPSDDTGQNPAADQKQETETPPAGERLVVDIKRGDSLDSVFRRHHLSVADLAQMLKLKEARNALKVIKPGDEIEVVRHDDQVLSLSRKLSEELTLQIIRGDDGYSAQFLANPVEHRPAQARAVINTSFFEAGVDAGLSDSLIMNLAGVFAWDIDFALEIREGDSFSVVYEEIWQDERRLRDGEVLAAEFINQGRVYRAIRYQDPNGRVGYFTPEGLSVKKAFLRAPVDFTRVSSNFNPNRLHPILKTKRPHKGVDYAAPKGTPVKAAGDGRVIFRGRNGGYGNCVILQHGGNVTTLYGHLSAFAKSAKKGSRVSQGQVIGFVGATGLATAPHLHYEYRLNGVHRNPRTVPLPEAAPVADKYRDQFLEASRPLIARLDAINPPRLARAN
jgi:murein DD-endopeptidase MepM/ murein hydrolase activator NlpD